MQWDDVRVLLALLATKNLAEAGARLGIDRSTVSRRLSALEEALGAKLFVRTRDGLRPTAAVERLRPFADRMELEATALTRAAASPESIASGVVRVATTEALAAFLVSEGLLSLRDEHPALVIELLGGNKTLDLARGEADIALRVVPLRDADLRARCVAKMPFGLFASPAYLARHGTPRAGGSLEGHDVLAPSGELKNLPEAQWLASRPGTRVVFRSSSMPALVAAAVAGHGLVALTLPWGDREPGLSRARVLTDVPPRPVWLATHAAGSSRAAVRVVCDRIAAVFARIPVNVE